MLKKIPVDNVIKEVKEIFKKPLNREGIKSELLIYFTQEKYNGLIKNGIYLTNARTKFTSEKELLNEVFVELSQKGKLQIIGLFAIS